jgi:hypothetical protein
LQVDEKNQIRIFLYYQVNRYLEDTYVLSNCAYHSHNVSKFWCKFTLNTTLIGQFQTYLLGTFILLIFFKFCNQCITNSMEVLMVLYFYLQIFLIYFFMCMSKNVPILNSILGRFIVCLLYHAFAQYYYKQWVHNDCQPFNRMCL